MSSSTSSSRRADAWRIALLVAGLLVVIEIVVRTSLIPRSRDLVNVGRVFPVRAEQLTREPGAAVAVVGNSVAGRGVDPALVRQALVEAGAGPVSVDTFAADASHINTWSFMIERYFCGSTRPPDLVVVIYFRYSLDDGHADDIGRLAQFLTRRSDWGEVFHVDLRAASERLQFVISSAWASFAVRDRIKERVLGLVIPSYKPFVLRLQAGEQGLQRHRPAPAVSASHRALVRLLRRAHECGTRLCFVAYPVLEAYDLNPEAVRLIAESGARFVDLRHVEGLAAAQYEDNVHLDAEGRRLFSRRLGKALVPFVKAPAPGTGGPMSSPGVDGAVRP